ncbi:MAG: Do family serine endopeptidase [Alphaproteobacteria bacterium]|nr:Do family serine endopeptidase [Alphaproteobacteria bacterium]
MTMKWRNCFAGLAAVCLLFPLAAEAGRAVPQSTAEIQLSFAPVVRRVAPAVVNVYSRTVVRQQVNPMFANPLFQQFFGMSPQFRKRVQQSLGSGVIVRADGVILTNNHVIEGGQDIVVALSDKREFKAKVLLADKRTDLAVLKINTHGERLPTIQFGNSDDLQVGDLVLAIGDPFGVGQTVTSGIVSALARTNVQDGNYSFFIQTDAAINPGNSGGALVTTDGRLAGINTAIYSQSGGSIGIGFAIPANLAKRVVDGALGGGIKLPWFGAEGQAVTADIARSIGMTAPQGVLLKAVYPGGPASKAGLKTGDVVVKIDGTEVDDMQGLNYRIATHKAGDTPSFKVFSDGHFRDVRVKLDLPPENPPRDSTTIGGRSPLTGAQVENLSPAVASDLQMDLMAKGVVVIAPGQSIAANQGFQAGDIVKSVNGVEIHTVNQLRQALEAGAQQGGWNLEVDRGGQRMSLSIRY